MLAGRLKAGSGVLFMIVQQNDYSTFSYSFLFIMKKIIFTILTISAFITPSFAFAGRWVEPVGDVYIGDTITWYQDFIPPASRCYADNGAGLVFFDNSPCLYSQSYVVNTYYNRFLYYTDSWHMDTKTALDPTPTPTPTPAGGFMIQLPDTGGLIASVSLATLGIFSDMTPIAMIIVGIILGLGLLTWVIARLPIKPEKTPWVDPDKHSL